MLIKVIKIGGNILDDAVKTSHFLNNFANLHGAKILVHGGGKVATELASTLGIESKLVDGKRITDAETLKIITMVYAGLINKNIVAGLQGLGVNAMGLTGADANIIKTTKRIDPEMDWGFVGDVSIKDIKAEVLINFMELGLIPILNAITHNGKGQLLNTNADTIASSVAAALAHLGHNVHLIYCFEKKGVLEDINDENTVIKRISPSYYLELKKKNIVNKGMLPKLDNAFKSLEDGVSLVKICLGEDLSDLENAGTNIVSD